MDHDTLALLHAQCHSHMLRPLTSPGPQDKRLLMGIVDEDKGVLIGVGVRYSSENLSDAPAQRLVVQLLCASCCHCIEDVDLLIPGNKFPGLLVAKNQEADRIHHRADGGDNIRRYPLTAGLHIEDGDDTPVQKDGEAGPRS
jgi:hypothetical protein